MSTPPATPPPSSTVWWAGGNGSWFDASSWTNSSVFSANEIDICTSAYSVVNLASSVYSQAAYMRICGNSLLAVHNGGLLCLGSNCNAPPPSAPPPIPPQPKPPPAPPPPPSAISITFTLSGDVADYDATKQTTIKSVVASAAGVDASSVTLDITPASVVVTVSFPVADTHAAKTMRMALMSSGALSSQSSLQSALNGAGLTGVVVESAPSFGWCCNPTGGFGDPHLTFAHGGKADFRGSDRDYFVFLSSPGYQFAPFFQEIDFVYSSATGLRQLVHGSFMTKASWFVRAGGEEYFLHALAMEKGWLRVVSDYHKVTRLGPWSKQSFGEHLKVETKMLTVSVITPTWSVNVTSKPIYGLVAPYDNATYESYHGRWKPNQRRFDISIRGDFPQPDAHGIIGQSYQDTFVRHGNRDDYGVESADMSHATSDGWLPPMTTKAQAEGAIEGVYTDYKLHADIDDLNVWTHAFKYSRYKLPSRTMDSNYRANVQQRVTYTSERADAESKEELVRSEV